MRSTANQLHLFAEILVVLVKTNELHSSVFHPSLFLLQCGSPSVFHSSVFLFGVFHPSVFHSSVFHSGVFHPSVFQFSVFQYSVFQYSVFHPREFHFSVLHQTQSCKWTNWLAKPLLWSKLLQRGPTSRQEKFRLRSERLANSKERFQSTQS